MIDFDYDNITQQPNFYNFCDWTNTSDNFHTRFMGSGTSHKNYCTQNGKPVALYNVNRIIENVFYSLVIGILSAMHYFNLINLEIDQSNYH